VRYGYQQDIALQITSRTGSITYYKLGLVLLLSLVFGGVPENAEIFVSQEDLALRIWAPSLGIWVSFSEFITSFDIYMSTLGNGAKECI